MNENRESARQPWYRELFSNYARTYDQEEFTKGTKGDVDFLEAELDYDKSKSILDIGCGTGRHAIELAGRGYQVTGIDLSRNQLVRAREKAQGKSVRISLLQGDACRFYLKKQFDAAIMLCEGGFPLMETDEKNFAILANAADSLKPGGEFIFSTLNALFPLYHSVKNFINNNSPGVLSEKNSFDLMTFRDHSQINVTDDSGAVKTLICNERYYAPAEISWLLKSLGFKSIGIYGCKLGEFSKESALTTDDYEMLVIAQK